VEAEGLDQRWLRVNGRAHIVRELDEGRCETLCKAVFRNVSEHELTDARPPLACVGCLQQLAEQLIDEETMAEAVGRGYLPAAEGLDDLRSGAASPRARPEPTR